MNESRPTPSSMPIDPNGLLFSAGFSDWEMNACLHFDPEAWFGYIDGYKMAADILVMHVATDRGDSDFLVYPIVFNYRHYVELALKYLTGKTEQLMDMRVNFSNEHDLRRLWAECRSLIEKRWADEPWEARELDAIGATIGVLGAVDERSFAFSYPKDPRGASYIPKELLKFNLRHFSEQMAKLASGVGSITEATLVHLEWKQEMDAEWAP